MASKAGLQASCSQTATASSDRVAFDLTMEEVTAAAGVVVGIAAGLIALAALIVSYLAWKEARRSADAAEKSAIAALRSAAAEEAALRLAEQEANQRSVDRHEADGPHYECLSGAFTGSRGSFDLRMAEGSGRVTANISIAPDSSLGMRFLEEGAAVEFIVLSFDGQTAHAISVELDREGAGGDPDEVRVPVLIVSTSMEEPARVWQSRLHVLLRREPGLYILRE